MKESRLAVETVALHYVFSYTDPDGEFTDSAEYTFNFTRVRFADLSPAAKRKICSPAAPGGVTFTIDDLAAGTFLLLTGVPWSFTGEGQNPILSFSDCCCHCAPRLYVSPLLHTGPELEVGTRTYTDPMHDPPTEPIYARNVDFSIITAQCRRGIKLVDHAATPDLTESADATLTTLVTGSASEDHEFKVEWENYDAIYASATVLWTDPDGVNWEFYFAIRRAPSYFLVITPIATVISVGEPTEADLAATADVSNRFRLSATKLGGRVGFIGVYGRQAITGLTLVDPGSTGTNFPDLIARSIVDIGTSHHIARMEQTVDGCPSQWGATQTYDIYAAGGDPTQPDSGAPFNEVNGSITITATWS